MAPCYGRVRFQGRDWSAVIEGERLGLLDGDWWSKRATVVAQAAVKDVTWLPPILPRTILCVGRNYRDHAAELGNDVPAEPLFFLKQWGALTAHEAVVTAPKWAGRIDYEGELVLVIGKTVRNVTSSREAVDAVMGLTVGNDITARQLQSRDGQWTRSKGFDGFAPVGPWVVLDQHPEGRQVTTTVNGLVRQDASTDAMIFPCDRLIMEASRFMTLYPGDLIFTGTPAGVGPVESGDVVEVTVQGVGKLSNLIKNGD